MNEGKLSKRLEAVAMEIPSQSVLADIGSDHAYLPCYAVLQGMISYAIAGEVVDGPFHAAQSNVQQCGLEAKISVRKGNGLDVLQAGEADVITIAGMGGALIRDILERGKDKLQGVTRLILQPNIGSYVVRKWLMENDWELISEKILEEDGKIYEILVAEVGDVYRPYRNQLEAGLLMGPYLLREQSDVFRKKWLHELTNLRRIHHQLEGAAPGEETTQKREEMTRKIQLIEEGLV
ncbi:tRNA (adenine(22)-N(1))-methyltransferase [Ectobacillus polymachus]|uniref:tRNA (adenine(22)-N(1))-methyltransferase n=1 Tax=Ectobacillus polymachus TaxID=1508806 RepID=UPI003A83E0F2